METHRAIRLQPGLEPQSRRARGRLAVLRVAALLTLGALGARHAPAYEYYTTYDGRPVRWSGGVMRLMAYSGDFPAGSAMRRALEDSVGAWNLSPAAFQFELGYRPSAEPPNWLPNNFVNEVYFTNSATLLNGAPARFWPIYFAGEFVEVDVIFDSAVSWSTTTAKVGHPEYGAGGRPFRNTALHEFGHALGLGHEADEYGIMGQDWNHLHANGNATHAYPGEDACDGAVAIYGASANVRHDVGVVHWRWSGAAVRPGTAYSEHARTRILRADGSTCAQFTDYSSNPYGEPGYEVSRGHTVRVEFTFENNGSTTQQPRVRYYLSRNDEIEVSDRDLGVDRQPTLTRDDVYTMTQEIVIPSDLVVGQTYYLGAVVDPHNQIAEVNESNNATYVAIRVQS
jgi:hypothetical protein